MYVCIYIYIYIYIYIVQMYFHIRLVDINNIIFTIY